MKLRFDVECPDGFGLSPTNFIDCFRLAMSGDFGFDTADQINLTFQFPDPPEEPPSPCPLHEIPCKCDGEYRCPVHDEDPTTFAPACTCGNKLPSPYMGSVEMAKCLMEQSHDLGNQAERITDQDTQIRDIQKHVRKAEDDLGNLGGQIRHLDSYGSDNRDKITELERKVTWLSSAVPVLIANDIKDSDDVIRPPSKTQVVRYCADCRKPLGISSFYTTEKEPICGDCWAKREYLDKPDIPDNDPQMSEKSGLSDGLNHIITGLEWGLNDAKYKAPEQMPETITILLKVIDEAKDEAIEIRDTHCPEEEEDGKR